MTLIRWNHLRWWRCLMIVLLSSQQVVISCSIHKSATLANYSYNMTNQRHLFKSLTSSSLYKQWKTLTNFLSSFQISLSKIWFSLRPPLLTKNPQISSQLPWSTLQRQSFSYIPAYTETQSKKPWQSFKNISYLHTQVVKTRKKIKSISLKTRRLLKDY